MPTFAFWKSAKVDESIPSTVEVDVDESRAQTPLPGAMKQIDMNPGDQESGVFYFDEADLPPSTPPAVESAQSASTPKSVLDAPSTPAVEVVEPVVEKLAVDTVTAEQGDPPVEVQAKSESLSATSPQPVSVSNDLPLRKFSIISSLSPDEQRIHSRPTSIASLSLPQDKLAINGARDSAVYLLDHGSPLPPSRPCSVLGELSSSSSTLKQTPLARSDATSQQAGTTIQRLYRPAELNLGFNKVQHRPKSELEQRSSVFIASKTQSKAALRSPTSLLRERLGMAPKEGKHEEKARVFTPPNGKMGGCILPGPSASMVAFTSTSIRARTEAGRPAWWCKFDKLVVFDSIHLQGNGEVKIHTRSSKGLSIARRCGDMETIVIPMDCGHCQEMLNRHEWKYDMRVCSRSVCWDCKERCKWEAAELARELELARDVMTPHDHANRYRADSMLQEEQLHEENLVQKVASV